MARRLALAVLALLSATCLASAQIAVPAGPNANSAPSLQPGAGIPVGPSPATASAGVTPPSCTSSLDFSAACNSQYLGAL